MNRYVAFGLSLASPMEFPELLVAPRSEAAQDPADVEVLESPALPDTGRPHGPGFFRFEIPAIGAFEIEDGARVRFARVEGVSDDQARLYLLGSCLGCVLQQRGFVVLHGNAVSEDGRTCRVIVGHSGAGKSTAAAWHYREGAKILADDVCAVEWDAEGIPRVRPSYPQIKLWRASADLLDIPVDGLRRIYGRLDKFCIPLGDRFASEALPLTEVIELDPRSAVESPVQGLQKVPRLLQHSYRFGFVKAMGLEPGYLKKVLRLAGGIAVTHGVRKNLGGAPPSAASDPTDEILDG